MFVKIYFCSLLFITFVKITIMLEALLAGGLLPAAGNLLGNAMNFASNKANNNANMKLAEYQWAKNLEMWNMQNEYNHPKSQMSRLKEAGLNPNLVYGNGSVGNTSGSMPTYNAPNLQAYQGFDQFGETVMKAVSLGLQKKQVDADVALKNKDLELKSAELISKNLANSKTEIERDFWIRQFEALTESMEQMAELRKYQVNSEMLSPIFKEKELGIHGYNAITGRMNANTNKMNAYTNRYNAESMRMNAVSARIQANATASKVSGELSLLPYQKDAYSYQLYRMMLDNKLARNRVEFNNAMKNAGMNPEQTEILWKESQIKLNDRRRDQMDHEETMDYLNFGLDAVSLGLSLGL